MKSGKIRNSHFIISNLNLNSSDWRYSYIFTNDTKLGAISSGLIIENSFEFVKGAFSKQTSSRLNQHFNQVKNSQKWIRIGKIVTCLSQNEIVNLETSFLIIQRFQSFILQAVFKLSPMIAYLFRSKSQRCELRIFKTRLWTTKLFSCTRMSYLK